MQSAKLDLASGAHLWEEEYRRGGIPSSVRTQPSNVVLDFVNGVRADLPPKPRALDIGCGTGRNSLYLAEMGMTVSAMDFAASQIVALNKHLSSSHTQGVTAVVADVAAKWPWESAAFDLAVDTFCFKHQIGTDAIINYASELHRCLAPGAYFLLFLATREDGYYRQFAVPHEGGPGLVIIDEGNGIASRLYARDEVEAIFEKFDVVEFKTKASVNTMHGKTYERESAIWYMRRS